MLLSLCSHCFPPSKPPHQNGCKIPLVAFSDAGSPPFILCSISWPRSSLLNTSFIMSVTVLSYRKSEFLACEYGQIWLLSPPSESGVCECGGSCLLPNIPCCPGLGNLEEKKQEVDDLSLKSIRPLCIASIRELEIIGYCILLPTSFYFVNE